RAELIDQGVELLVPERFRAKYPKYFKYFFANPKAQSMDVGRNQFGLHKDGHEIPVELSLHPLETGEGLFVLASIFDITERKQMDEARLRMAAIVEFSDDAIISKSLQGTITSWNPGAQKIFGYTPQEALGKSILMLFPPERHREEVEIRERLERGENVDHF